MEQTLFHPNQSMMVRPTQSQIIDLKTTALLNADPTSLNSRVLTDVSPIASLKNDDGNEKCI